jgi:hypothetical protein
MSRKLIFFFFLLLILAETAAAAPLDNWRTRTSGTTSDLYNVVWGENKFLTVGRAGSIITSPDGNTWTVGRSGTETWLYGIAYGNNTFVASGQAGTILTSSDGTSWTSRSTGTNALLFTCAFGMDRFVVVGESGTILTSTDSQGSSWIAAQSGVTNGLYGVTYGNNRFVIVGESGVVLTSPDGFNWTQRSSGATDWWFDAVAYGNNTYVSPGGNDGAGPIAVITSPDGSTWKRSATLPQGDFYSIAFGNETFVAVGSHGSIFVSPDGAGWNSVSSVTQTSLRGVAFGNNTFVATGFDGVIIQSDAVTGAPISKAGQNQTVAVGTLVTLDGSGSYDPDGTDITYAWEMASRPWGSSAFLTNPTRSGPTFTADVSGTYTVTLVVTDASEEQSLPGQVIITAGNPPTADAGQNQSWVKVGTRIVLDGTESYDSEGREISFAWEMLSRPSNSNSALSDVSSEFPTFIPDARGTYKSSLVVTNSIGLKSQPSEVTVTAGSRPVANAGTDQAVRVGEQVILDGSGSSSPDQANPLSYAWQNMSRPTGSNSTLTGTTTPRPTFLADVAGVYTVSLVVKDPAGFQSQPSNVAVTATQPEPLPAPGPGPEPVPAPDPGTAPAAPVDEGGGGGGSGCFIATAVYGTPTAPEVIILKRFRDKYLLTNPLGVQLVSWYYKLSPPAARFIQRHERLRIVLQALLGPVVQAAERPLLSTFFFCMFLALVVVNYFSSRTGILRSSNCKRLQG